MRSLRLTDPAAIVVALGSLARPAAAQVFELGGGLSRGCIGDSSGFCGDDTGAMWALHGGVWVSPGWQISLRVATLPLPDATYSTTQDERFDRAADPAVRAAARIDITTRERSRQLAGAEAIYHFAGPRRFGAVLGVGIGEVKTRSTLSCEPAGCEDVMRGRGEPAGRIAPAGFAQSDVHRRTVGTRVDTRPDLRRRATAQLRRRELSTAEAFLTTGIRLGSF